MRRVIMSKCLVMCLDVLVMLVNAAGRWQCPANGCRLRYRIQGVMLALPAGSQLFPGGS